MSNSTIISSDCPNGPKEILANGNAGYLFQSNKKNELAKMIQKFDKQEKTLNKMRIHAKKNSSKYSLFRHYLNLNKILINENKT